MKKISEIDAFILLSALRTVLDIFIGPFLAAYFVSSTMDSLSMLVKYYAVMHCFLCFTGFISSRLTKKGLVHIVFTIGVIVSSSSIVFIALIKEALPNYYYILAMIYGVGSNFYWFAFNLFNVQRIDVEQRGLYENKKALVNKGTSIIIPVVLGGIISASDFFRTALIIVVLSVVMVVLSFRFEKSDVKAKYDVKPVLQWLINTKQGRHYLISESSYGLFTVLPGFCFPALTFMNNHSNLGLGFVSSSSALIFVFIQFFVRKIRSVHPQSDDYISLICPGLSIASISVYLLFPSLSTIIIAYISYSVFSELYLVVMQVKEFGCMRLVDNLGQEELIFVRECLLFSGRIFGIFLLYLVLKINQNFVPYLLAVLISTMYLNSCFVNRLEPATGC